MGRTELLMAVVSEILLLNSAEAYTRFPKPETKFDKPILNFDNPNLACLVEFGIKNVVWETPACSQALVQSVLKPINGADQEPLLELLGMSVLSLYIICV